MFPCSVRTDAVSQFVHISEAASLALHTMAVLAKHTARRFTTQEIADVLHASGHHLAKVMQRLVRAGLVDSIRGPQGGFRLGRPAGQVTLLEVYEAVEGPVDERGCLLGQPLCSGKDCVLGEVVQSVHVQIRDSLKRTTLAKLAGGLGLSIPVEGLRSNG